MNTNLLKKFAQDARKKLLEQVGAKLSFVLTTDSVELREKADQVSQLREELSRSGKSQLIEKVAYTWFNRLMALRFMDANDYQPMGIRVITPKDGYTIPELLDESKRGNIPEELKVNRQRVYDLLDNRIPSTNPQNEAYKELLIATCNHLNTVFPFLFEKISDYTELLIPDDLTSDFSIVTDVREGMPIEDCANVEIIGWLYQFYISEKKDEVFASKSAVKKEDIPAATQLFTPRWIVEYMVQNTVGKLWLQNRPKSKLREYMPYFIESTTMKSEDFLKINSPEEIRLLDPASGSGHILVYAFDLFTKIYEEEGYSTNDIPKLIIEKNLNGFEIDERAAQLSGLALMMKAREYNRRAFKKDLQPSILCFQDIQLSQGEIKETLDALQITVSDELMHDLINMQQATNFGSLILPLSNLSEMVKFNERLNQIKTTGDLFQKNIIDALQIAISQLIKLAPKFHCVVTNPPYMGNGNMNNELSEFVKVNYPDSKVDLMACFMEVGFSKLQRNGFISMVNMHSWMFLSSYERLRIKTIKQYQIESILHLGMEAFDGIIGKVVQTAAWVMKNRLPNGEDLVGIRLVDYYDSLRWEKQSHFYDKKHRYIANQNDFKKIPSSPIAYWLRKTEIETFDVGIPFEKLAEPRVGLDTGNNNLYLRYFHEIEYSKIGFSFSNYESFQNADKYYVPHTKGGEYRKWYGNFEFVLKFDKYNYDKLSASGNHLPSKQYYFREGANWSRISSNKFALRYTPEGFVFNSACPTIFSEYDTIIYLIGFLTCPVSEILLNALSPTMNFQAGEIRKLPIILDNNHTSNINSIIESNIEISRKDWDLRETSWHFLQNHLICIKGQDIEESYDLYQQYWTNKFFQLHKNEEELNRQFIELYNLQEELIADVDLDDITILKEETNIKSGQLVFKANEVFAQFISYAVGCMFGRYSLDKEGLVLANEGETLQDYLHRIDKTANECSFLPDEDNIIPVLDDEWFEDDITGRFYKFLKVSFGEANFNKNLQFVEEHLGKDIRKYFTKDFYPDHIKRYKKRPIYWMFSSPKGSFNVLIYLHRYTQDTVSDILNKYLKEFIGKLKTRKETLQHLQVSGSASEKTKAIKENVSIDKMLIELHEYERDVLFPLATDRIPIDLDDGVLVNYNKFGKAVKEVAGLNDKKTKEKVMGFDWIDTTQIR